MSQGAVEIVNTRMGGKVYLGVSGVIENANGLVALRQNVQDCVERNDVRVVLDLDKVPTITSAALECFLDVQDDLAQAGGSLLLVNANDLVRDIFRITGFDNILERTEGGSAYTESLLMLTKPPRLGEMLVERGLITEDQVAKALSFQSQSGKRLGQILVANGWVAETKMLQALSEKFAIPYVGLRPGLYDSAAARLVPKSFARRLHVLPLFKVRNLLFLATSEPQFLPGIDEVENRTGLKIRPVLTSSSQVEKFLEEAYAEGETLEEYIGNVDQEFEVVDEKDALDYTSVDEMAEDSPVINLVNAIINQAVRDGASDIHIEPSRTKCRVRFRIDGVLFEVMSPRLEMHAAIVSRLKVVANLDIAERRLPQDGRIQVKTQSRTVDLRFSSLPGIAGEKVVLRILDKDQGLLDVEKLGMTEEHVHHFKKSLKASNGLILVTGPTGSGKTTTLYAAINYLNSLEKNIVTIEDPVEYLLDIVNQNQVKESIGLTFAKMLKHILRQDPDIVMVGEIRDAETAEIAIRAALTGHLVLSTLHTNDSASAITRLLEMGVKPYLLSAALLGVVGQRLVRKICPECKTHYLPKKEFLEQIGLSAEGAGRLAKGRGCTSCYDSGYKGRLGIYEFLQSDTQLRSLVCDGASHEAIKGHLLQAGMKTMLQHGLDFALRGITTPEEVYRVVGVER